LSIVETSPLRRHADAALPRDAHRMADELARIYGVAPEELDEERRRESIRARAAVIAAIAMIAAALALFAR
jgi:hypothetical protein